MSRFLIPLILCFFPNAKAISQGFGIPSKTLPIIQKPSIPSKLFLKVSPDQHIWSDNCHYDAVENILYLNERDKHSILLYYLSFPDSIVELRLPHHPYNDQFYFHPYQSDKYVVIYDPAKNMYGSYSHDSCIYVYDRNLNLKEIHGLLDFHPCVYGNQQYDTCRYKLYLTQVHHPASLYDNHILFNVSHGEKFLGDKQFLSDQVPLSGSVDLITGRVKDHKIYFPGKVDVNFPYKSNVAIIFSGHEKKKVYYNFPHTNFIFQYDLEKELVLDTSIITNTRFSSAWQNSNIYLNESDPTKFPLTHDSGKNILFDSIRQLYYRFFYRAPPANTLRLAGRPKYSFVEILDTQFRALGYFTIPETSSLSHPPPFIHPKGLAIFDLNTQPYGDSLLRIDIYDLSGPLVTEEQDLFAGEDLVATRYREGAKGYRQHWQSDAPRLLYFSYFSTCPSCLEWYKKVILQYPEAFRKGEIDLVLHGNGEEVLQFRDSLAAHEIPVYFDSTGYYQVFFRQNFVNPTLFQEADDFQEGETFQPRQKQQLEILLKELSEK